MSGETNSAASVERLLGEELAEATRRTLADARLGGCDSALAARLRAVHGLLALYRELRYHHLTAPGDSAVGVAGGRFGVPGTSRRKCPCAEAELTTVDAPPPVPESEVFEPEGAVRLATAQILLALYWELRHQGLGAPATGSDAGLEWVSGLLCAPPGLDHRPDDLAVPGGQGTPRAGSQLHHP
jgi:hypothetical protein